MQFELHIEYLDRKGKYLLDTNRLSHEFYCEDGEHSPQNYFVDKTRLSRSVLCLSINPLFTVCQNVILLQNEPNTAVSIDT